MTTETAILNSVRKLPEAVKQSVLLYTEFLASQYAKENLESTACPSQKAPLAGSMKGLFVLPLPDDFNEPLEDFEEYM